MNFEKVSEILTFKIFETSNPAQKKKHLPSYATLIHRAYAIPKFQT